MRLVDDWRKAWKWFSVQAMVIAGAIQTAWLAIPTDMKSSIPVEWVTYATATLLFLGVIGRLVKQND